MIPRNITDLFPHFVRQRGDAYFAEKRVGLTKVNAGKIEAVVEGTQEYHVRATVNRGDLASYSCTCPYASDYGTCKHLWAVLRAADGEGVFGSAHTYQAAPPTKPKEAPRRVPDWQHRLIQAQNLYLGKDHEAAVTAEPLATPLEYRLDLDYLRSMGEVSIDVRSPGARRRFSAEQWLQSTDPLDRELAHKLIGAHTSSFGDFDPGRRFTIPPVMYDSTLRQICDTGRCVFWSSAAKTTTGSCSWDDGPHWRVRFAVEADDKKSWRLRGYVFRGDVQVLLDDVDVISAHGLLVRDHTLARVDVADAWPLLLVMRTSGPIVAARDELFDLAAELMITPSAAAVQLPPEANITEVRPDPQPLLYIRPAQSPYDTKLKAELTFLYDGLKVKHERAGNAVIDREEERIVHRDRARERAALQRLQDLGAEPAFDWRSGTAGLVVPARKLDAIVLELVRENWQVEADGKRYRSATRTDAAVRSGIDWFELQGGAQFGDQHVGLPELLKALKRGQNTVLLDDGSHGLLPAEWLRRFSAIADLSPSGEGAATIRFTRAQTALLDALLAVQPEIQVDETFERIRTELARFDRVTPLQEPAGFHGKLRQYQREGLGWMAFLRQFELGGCLADDMGLGKTVQVLALLEQRRIDAEGPSLVVVPKSLVFNWLREAERFAPELRVRDYTGTTRRQGKLDPTSFDVLITTYGTLRRDAPHLAELEFDYAILDEAQAIKNSSTASAKAARLLRARHRLALSGTPIENNLNELWSLFEFLNPGMLGAARAFSVFKNATSARNGDDGGRELLARALRPFLLRRTKEQVAPELPPRVEQTLVVELEAEQRKHYTALRDHYRIALLGHVDKVGIKRAQVQILEALLRLRQAACDLRLVDPKRPSESAKLDVLMEQFAEVIAEGHRALVFSQFTTFLALLRERLDKAGYTYEYLDGKTKNRQARVDRFQNDEACSLFLISLRAGGQGLNLTAADYVFMLDPWWNPAVEAQAIDRTHRIGQRKRVIALRLIARDTVEEKVLTLQKSKRDLADAILSADAGIISRITRSDLELLLE